MDYSQWFETLIPKDRQGLPGNDGAEISWTVNDKARTSLNAAADFAAAHASKERTADQAIHYRRPVPVKIAIKPCVALESGAGAARAVCTEDTRPIAAGMSASSIVGFPQLATESRIAIGKGGMFGSSTVAAQFDANGAPTVLKYGTDPGAAQIATAIDATAAAGKTLRDAEAGALARQSAMLKSRKDIRDLMSELAKAD